MRSEILNAKQIFLEAVEIDAAADRGQFLDEACQGDDVLRGQVEALLRALDEPNSMLDGAGLIAARDVDLPTPVGSNIGPYTIREQLGEGGMGVVYVAEQTEPVRRKVALKIIRPGTASRDVIARFEAERQALAMMDHPNIARVFDGGVTDAHLPYFVMELVRGLPITEYCDQQQLDVRERLELYLSVCRAVQHAHQKGVIHRDLKPSNIVVAEIDGAAVAKVIDFGVAKAINQKLTEQTVYTQYSHVLGSPLYMSPEQASLGVVDVDTRSDVYSLGVLMYELLSGRTPFDRDAFKRAGYDEIRRMIREDEPPKPSAMVSTLGAKALSTVAERRHSDSRALVSSLRGELDWLVTKAMEKDRNRRYESAAALSEDVQRYLDDRPVLARPPGIFYRARKFARRNRALVASTAAVLCALVTGLTLATAGFWTARQRLAEVTKEQENNRVLIDMLSDMYPTPWGMETLGLNHTVYDAIEEISPTLDQRLREHPAVEMKVRKIFADAYFAAREFDQARSHLNRALQLAVDEFGEIHETVADVHAALADEVGWNYDVPLDYGKKLEHAEQAIKIYEALGVESPGLVSAWFAKGHCLLLTSPERRAEAEAAQRRCAELASRLGNVSAIAHWDLGLLLMDLGDDRLDDAEAQLRKAVAISQAGEQPLMHQATALSGLARCLRRQGDLPAAAQFFRQAWQLCQSDAKLRNEPRGFRTAHRIAETYFALGDVEQAFDFLRRLEEQHALASAPVESRANHLLLKGWLFLQLENYRQSAELFRPALELSEQSRGNANTQLVYASMYLALSLEAMGRRDESADAMRPLIPRLKPFVESPYVRETPYWGYARAVLGSSEDRQVLSEALDAASRGQEFLSRRSRTWLEPAFYHVVAGLSIRLGDRQSAIQSLTQGLEKAREPRATWRASYNLVPTMRQPLEVMLARLYQEDGDAEEAIRVLKDGVQERKKLGENHIQVALAQLRLGELLVEQSNYTAAEQPLRAAFDKLKPHPEVVDPLRRRAVVRLAEVYRATNQPEKSAHWQVQADELTRSNEDDDAK